MNKDRDRLMHEYYERLKEKRDKERKEKHELYLKTLERGDCKPIKFIVYDPLGDK